LETLRKSAPFDPETSMAVTATAKKKTSPKSDTKTQSKAPSNEKPGAGKEREKIQLKLKSDSFVGDDKNNTTSINNVKKSVSTTESDGHEKIVRTLDGTKDVTLTNKDKTTGKDTFSMTAGAEKKDGSVDVTVDVDGAGTAHKAEVFNVKEGDSLSVDILGTDKKVDHHTFTNVAGTTENTIETHNDLSEAQASKLRAEIDKKDAEAGLTEEPETDVAKLASSERFLDNANALLNDNAGHLTTIGEEAQATNQPLATPSGATILAAGNGNGTEKTPGSQYTTTEGEQLVAGQDNQSGKVYGPEGTLKNSPAAATVVPLEGARETAPPSMARRSPPDPTPQ
jgi:hypothetical protein